MVIEFAWYLDFITDGSAQISFQAMLGVSGCDSGSDSITQFAWEEWSDWTMPNCCLKKKKSIIMQCS
jgi:hypothetical protein